MGTAGHGPRTAVALRTADGVRLHVVLHSDRTRAGRGLTVVLLHGWTVDSRLWRHQLAVLPHRLAAEAVPVRILTVDLRGHGRSTPTPADAATLTNLADDLAAVLRELATGDRAVLVGHSLGGMTILEYAHRHPEDFAARTAGVVLVNSSAEGALHTRYGLPGGLAQLVRAMELGGSGLLARFGPWHPHRHVMPALMPGVRWLVFGDAPNWGSVRLVADMVGSASLRSIGAFRPAIDRHRRIAALAAMRDIPVDVLVGSHDRLTPPACAAAIGAELVHARLEVVDRAGHMLPLERPDVVTDAIVRTVRQAVRVDGSAPGG